MIITLLTDFGGSDYFVGVMKGVLLGIRPDVRIVDIAHGIDPQHVDQAAFVLRNAWPYFPQGTIHVIVVDPGVGGDRAGLMVKAGGQWFVAPDNGVLKYVYHHHPEAGVYKISNPIYGLSRISRTFHGRDVFAPVAAHLAAGVPVTEIGEPMPDFIRGEMCLPTTDGHAVRGEIIYFDHFGNAITNIPEKMVNPSAAIVAADETIRLNNLSKTYSDVDPGKVLALIGSHGNLEIAVRNGNAKQGFGMTVHDQVVVEMEEGHGL